MHWIQHSLFDSGDFSKALDYIDKLVLVYSPGCMKEYSSVISETGFMLKEDENNLEALLLRGRAYYYLSDHDVASRHYQQGLRLDPEHSELKKAYFGLKKLLKKTKSAEDNAAKGKLCVAVEDFRKPLLWIPIIKNTMFIRIPCIQICCYFLVPFTQDRVGANGLLQMHGSTSEKSPPSKGQSSNTDMLQRKSANPISTTMSSIDCTIEQKCEVLDCRRNIVAGKGAY